MHRMMIYIIVGILLLGLIFYFILKPDSQSTTNLDNYFISTQSQSNERIKNLDLNKPSENASNILDTNKLSFPHIKKRYEKVEYKADSEREWVIELITVNGNMFRKEDFDKMFDYEWRNKFPSTIYGFSPQEDRWTFAQAGGVPEIYSKLQVAIDVQGVYNDENPDYNPKKLERYIIELEKRIKKYPTKLKIEQKESFESAINKAKELITLYQEFNCDAIIVLQNEKPFNGLLVWDALQSVGLNWGDGDLFHWENEKDYGSDRHFSVWTTTEPGYFLPEEVKNGEMNPQNLVFGFSIPRNADPKNVFEIMLNVVQYCQKRLGGQILDKNGKPFDVDRERRYLVELIRKMETKGMVAGSDKALRMF